MRTQANEHVGRGEADVISRENWGCRSQRSTDVFRDGRVHPHHYLPSARLLSSTDTILRTATETRDRFSYTTICRHRKHVLRFRVCSNSTTVNYRQGCFKSTSASTFELMSSWTFSWATICYTRGLLLNDIRIFWRLFYWYCFNTRLEVRGRECEEARAHTGEKIRHG